jgi:PAS domain S-box-containing protein
MGYSVPGTADTGISAIRMAGELKPDLVLMDITLKGPMSGIEAAGQIRERYGLPVVYMTGHTDESTVEKAIAVNPFGYIVKPVDTRILKITLRMALLKHAIEDRLRRNEFTTRALLNAVPDALMLVDSERAVVAVNEAMAQKLGMAPAAIKGMPAAVLAAGGALGITPAQLEEHFSRGIPVTIAESRGDRWFETSMHPVAGPHGGIGLVAIQSRDITDTKLLEAALEREGISQIERNMEQFQILNDQIRNPLQAIKGYLALIDSEYTGKIDEQLAYIDDIVTRLDQGWLESEKVRTFLYRHYQHGIQGRAGHREDVMYR